MREQIVNKTNTPKAVDMADTRSTEMNAKVSALIHDQHRLVREQRAVRGRERGRPDREVRMGWGAFDLPDGGGITANVRERFFWAISRTAPCVLTDLSRGPLTAYSRCAATEERDDCDNWQVILSADDEYLPALLPLRDALQSWAARWNLTPDWCIERALTTLTNWHQRGDAIDPGSGWCWAAHATFTAIREVDRRFTFGHDGWDVQASTRVEAADAIRATFERDLKAYLDGMEDHARERGLVPTPAKRELAHFGWLARYQVLGESYTAIAKSVCHERKTVTDAVKAIAVMLALPPRSQSRGGRPRKQA